MVEFGVSTLQSETELILKSRRVVSTKLLQSGFSFQLPRGPKRPKIFGFDRERMARIESSLSLLYFYLSIRGRKFSD